MPRSNSPSPSQPRVAGWAVMAAFTVALLAVLVALSELLLLPRILGAPRALALMGWAATTARVGDTPINALGFTGDVPALPKQPATLRVLTLGGSSMFNRRMTERLRTALQRRYERPVEVLGAALRMHTSRASVIKYDFLSKYRFDVVLIYEGINDLWANHVTPERFRDDYGHLSPWYIRAPLLDHSLVARVVFNRWVAKDTRAIEDFLRDPSAAAVNGANFRSAVVLENNLRALVERVRQDGGLPVLITFAWYIPPDYSLAAFEAGKLGYVNPDKYDSTAVEVWGPPAYVEEGLRLHNDAVRRVARETGAPLLDQEKMLWGRAELFGDVCHFNEAGTVEFIGNVVDFLDRAGRDGVGPAAE